MRGQASGLRKPRRLDSMRCRLRTLLIVLILLPLLLAASWLAWYELGHRLLSAPVYTDENRLPRP
jgi:hypothetical protein